MKLLPEKGCILNKVIKFKKCESVDNSTKHWIKVFKKNKIVLSLQQTVMASAFVDNFSENHSALECHSTNKKLKSMKAEHTPAFCWCEFVIC